MSIIEKLPAIIRDARNEYNTILAKTPASLKITESVRTADQARNDSQPEGIIYAGDNIELIGAMLNGEAPGFGNLRGKVQVVYIDPPFYTKARYASSVRTEGANPSTLHQEAYTDVWSEGPEEYLRMLCIRFFAIRDLLSDTGSLWVHLDWHIVHYVKILLDEIFGADNFVNEIIWNYKSGGASKRHFARKHDTLLFYSKTSSYYLDIPKEKSYNRGFAPYRFKGVTEYQDEIGWYTLVNMKDVWQLDMVGRTAGERTGYATQKPEALLSRIVESCSKPGDIVCDFFGGSGTTAAVAAINDRKFISADTGSLAIASERRRLAAAGISFDIIKGNRGVQNSALELEVMDNCINLRGYNPGDLSSLGLDAKSEDLAKEILKSDSLALIAYWAVDAAYDGSVFRPSSFALPGKDGLARSLGYARPAGSQGSGLAVLAVDIFGTETLKVIK